MLSASSSFPADGTLLRVGSMSVAKAQGVHNLGISQMTFDGGANGIARCIDIQNGQCVQLASGFQQLALSPLYPHP